MAIFSFFVYELCHSKIVIVVAGFTALGSILPFLYMFVLGDTASCSCFRVLSLTHVKSYMFVIFIFIFLLFFFFFAVIIYKKFLLRLYSVL